MAGTSNKPYRVHVGYTRATGRDRWRYYETLADAQITLNAVFQNTRKVLTVVANPNYKPPRVSK